MPEKTKIFVYGTLKRGRGLHQVLSNSTFLGPLVVSGEYILVDLGAFPGMVHIPGFRKGHVVGEVYEVDRDTLKTLDRIEGHPDFYTRTQVKNSDIEAYMLPAGGYAHRPQVRGGEW